MQRSISSVSIKLATLTAALALSGAAYAATGTVASTPVAAQTAVSAAASDASGKPSAHRHHKAGERHKSGHHHKSMRDAALWVPGYGPLNTKFVESLALNDTQAKLLKEVQTEQKTSREARRDAMKSARVAGLEQLKSGKIDPHAKLKQTEEAHKQAYAERSKLDGKWLAVWDALDATQQEKVAAKFNERAEKFAKRAENHKQRKAAPDTAKVAS